MRRAPVGFRWSFKKGTAQIAAGTLLAASASMFLAGTALAAGGGNNGTVKIGSGTPTNANDPHLTCPISVFWSGFDSGALANNQFQVSFSGINPTGGTVTPFTGATSGSFNTADHTESYQLNVANATPKKNGEIHVNIDITTTTSNGNSDLKSKTVWLTNCNLTNPVQTVSLTGQCNTGTHVFDWTIATTPAGAVSGTYTPQGGAATNYTTALPAGTTTFSTGLVNQVAFTVSTAGWTPGTTPVTAAANPACAAAVHHPTATVTATCNTLSAHLDANGAGSTVFDIAQNGTTDHQTTSTTKDVPYTAGAGKTITVSSGGVQLATATSPANCGGGGNPTPSSATAHADCNVLSAHLVPATPGGTTFTIVENGNTVTETTSVAKDVSYVSAAGASITVSDGAAVLDSATAPANCGGGAGQADPAVSSTNHCKSGINLVLSNMNGTAGTAFLVTAPDGTRQTVAVGAGQIKKLAFAVEEDTTGVVTVSAPGLAKQTFTYKKNCASVLGIKHVRKPHVHQPTQTPAVKVEGEKSTLPFTGTPFNVRRALFDGAALMLLGGLLCAMASRRRGRFEA